MVHILFKFQIFFLLYFLAIIGLSLINKYGKCKEKILKVGEFIWYLNQTPIIFFNSL